MTPPLPAASAEARETMSEPERKTEFWWASVADAPYEPVEVTMLAGERVAYTCGCNDPFYLDRPDCLLVLLAKGEHGGAMERPRTPDEKHKARLLELSEIARLKRHHWRGPR